MRREGADVGLRGFDAGEEVGVGEDRGALGGRGAVCEGVGLLGTIGVGGLEDVGLGRLGGIGWVGSVGLRLLEGVSMAQLCFEKKHEDMLHALTWPYPWPPYGFC